MVGLGYGETVVRRLSDGGLSSGAGLRNIRPTSSMMVIGSYLLRGNPLYRVSIIIRHRQELVTVCLVPERGAQSPASKVF